MRKKFRYIAALSVFALALTGCGGQASSGDDDSGGGLTTVSVGQVQLSIFAPMYVAQKKGYFKDEGIKLSLKNIKSGQDGVPLASSGKLDALVAGFSAGMFSAIDSGLDVKVVGSMGVQPAHDEPSPSALVVSNKLVKSGDYKSLKDLKGKKIAAAGGIGGTGAYYISMALKKAGLSLNDVKLVNLGNPDIPTAVKNGSVDAAFASSPFYEQVVNDKAAKKVWTTPKGTSGTGVIYGGKFASTDTAQHFFNALARGAKDLQGKKRYSKENVKIIADATDQTPKQVKSVPLYTWLPDLHPLPKQLSEMEKAWMDVGAIKYSDPIPQSKYVDTDFAKKAKTAK
ncbi:ABC transporter substrate-binding protein [Spelaeicoccus albus]|uniref:NitT/TauT family transport system substrate-binding protein n=1 Tax=Spelaeicoccus albus TaxID=1280376 RepID=A0A7Z0A9T4_9MICO|nr:ABC transporter substrate-binding protein [Spelaeicoccus albus]NYI67039.1 NitT/TauT family transport system substrate-binding protein [Spelaeicoccus albus]